MTTRSLSLSLILLASLALITRAADLDLKYFRSNHGTPDTLGALPSDFDTPGSLRWKIPLDPGHSTPILADGKIFLTAWHDKSKELIVLALDEKTGKTLWTNGIAVSQVEQLHQLGNPATPTPACDGKRLYVFFGSYGLIAYDLNGKRLWEYKAGPFRDEYGAGSSPILYKDKVIINQDHDIDSFVMALNASNGKPVWKTPRPDAVRSYSTPALWSNNGRDELLVAGALELTAYDPNDGKKIWWINGLARIVIPTPVPLGDTVYMASWAPGGDAAKRLQLDAWPAATSKWDANHDGKLSRAEIKDNEVIDRFFRMDLNQDGVLDQAEWERHAAYFSRAQNSLLAIKPAGRTGQLPDDAVVWKHPKGIPYVSTPVVDRGIIYMVKEGGIVTKLDLSTHQLLQEERVAGVGNYFSSPVAGDGKIYFASEPGTISVLASQPDWKVISSHEFHEKIYATPAFGPNCMYIRTEKALYNFQAIKE